ncbi:MAG: aromatic ring-hydroxylating dioxygenase subunit alpha [Rhodoferax sp.]|nr:aromatic ring-hydroxylating dioxygenase subunit alpha [Rhodoferax sp.]
MSDYLRNAWYVAALSRDVNRLPVARRLLGEPLVLFRSTDGRAIALEDACPHRKLPLSMGRVQGDAIECGYHGLTFDCTGRCINAATQDRIPPYAQVRSYPVRDRYGLTFVWMGDPAMADESTILDIEHHDDPAWTITQGDFMPVRCHYLWLVDNLLDPSHVAWVHTTSFAGAGTDRTPLIVEDQSSGVLCSRWMLDQPPPPFYAPLVRFAGNADRLQHYEMRYPSVGINKGIYTPAGLGGPGMQDGPLTYRMASYHFITPVDDDNTLYFWLQHRNTDIHDQELTRRIAAGARAAFEEDRAILEAVHLGMKNSTTRSTGLLLDAGANRFRKGLSERIARERAIHQAGSASL